MQNLREHEKNSVININHDLMQCLETQVGKRCCLFLSKFCGPNVQYHFCPETPLNVTHGHLTPSPIPPKPPPSLLQVLQGEGGRTAPLRKARNLPEQSPVYSPLGNPQRGRWEGAGAGAGTGARRKGRR